MTHPISSPSRSAPARPNSRPGLQPSSLPRQVADRTEIVEKIVGNLRDQSAAPDHRADGGLDVTA